MSILEKKITITIDSNGTKLNTPLNFYVNDKVRLAFTIKEFEYKTVNTYSRSKVLKTVTPLSGFLSVETPLGVDKIEYVEIVDDVIYFELDSTYTACAGKYNAQLFLTTDSGYQKAIPPFSFSVNHTINEVLDGRPRTEVILLINDRGECLLANTNELLIFK